MLKHTVVVNMACLQPSSIPKPLYARPNQGLRDHLLNTADLSRMIIHRISDSFGDYRSIWSDVAYIIGYMHDFGKATPWFQLKVRGYDVVSCTSHSDISAVLASYIVHKYLINHFGKRYYEDKYLSILPIVSFYVILNHHGSLDRGDRNLYGWVKNNEANLKDKYSSMLNHYSAEYSGLISHLDNKFSLNLSSQNLIEDAIKFVKSSLGMGLGRYMRFSDDENLELYYIFLMFFSALLDADRVDVVGLEEKIFTSSSKHLSASAVDKYVRSLIRNDYISQFRNQLYEHISKRSKFDHNSRIFLVNLPTGAGKTFINLRLAFELQNKLENQGLDSRVIYVLPYLSIIDQTAERIEEILKKSGYKVTSDIFLVHHHLVEPKYITDEESYEGDEALFMIEDWTSKLVVTTFVQFFSTIFSVSNRSSRRFHRLKNSIVILDEVQTVPYRYWKVLNDAIQYLSRKYNTHFIISTATPPQTIQFGSQIYHGEIITSSYKVFGSKRFYNFLFDDIGSLNELAQSIVDDIMNDSIGSILAVVNTIKSSQELFLGVIERLRQQFGSPTSLENGIYLFDGEIEVGYLSSYIVPADRLGRIRLFRGRNNSKKILISTQVVEAGVDISFQRVYRDIAPLDSIIQSGGRCNRHGEFREGYIYVTELANNTGRIYASMVYGSEQIDSLRNIVQPGVYSEGSVYSRLLPQYYNELERKMTPHEIRSIRSLNFSSVGSINLIGYEPDRMQVFIEIDDNASKLIKTVEALSKISDRRIRYGEFRRIRNDFYKYVVNVRREDIRSASSYLREIEGLNVLLLSNEYIDQLGSYRRDIGFNCMDDNYII